MSDRIKLSEPGTELVLHIKSVKAENLSNTDYWLFDSGQKEMLIPQSSMESRLTGLGVANVQQMVGMTVCFSRSTKMSKYGKPYWDCVRISDLPETPRQPTAAPSPTGKQPFSTGTLPFDDGDPGPTEPFDGELSSLPQPGQSTPQKGQSIGRLTTRQSLIEAYRQAWAAAMDVQGPDSTPEALNAGAATILIQWAKAGLV